MSNESATAYDWSLMHRALQDVGVERFHQELQTGVKFDQTCAAPTEPPYRALAVLGEEFGEVARALLEGKGDGELRGELVQVAAVAVAWVEAIDARSMAIITRLEGGAA